MWYRLRVQRNAAVACAIFVGIALACAAMYLRAGLAAAFLSADDFQWLSGARSDTWAGLLRVASREHFYRPVVELWFAGAVRACGAQTPCHHFVNLALHLSNVALMLVLGVLLFHDVRIAALGALIFAIEPAATEAVVWISAATALVATFFYLATLLAQRLSWTVTGRRRVLYEIAAVLLFLLGLFAHEAVSTLPLVAWLMWRRFGPGNLLQRPILACGGTLALLVFAAATVMANLKNYVFTQSHYTFGTHAVGHAFDYFVALYVGPAWWLAYIFCAVGIGLLLAATPVTRLGAAWLLVTLLPYVWFTWGNASRYLYLPSIGFGWAIAGAAAAAADYLRNRWRVPAQYAMAVFLLIAAFIGVRFGRFAVASVRGHIAAMEPWRAYAAIIAADNRRQTPGTIEVMAPTSPDIDRSYIEPMVRWLYQDNTLTVRTVD